MADEVVKGEGSKEELEDKPQKTNGRGEWIRTTDLLVPNLGKAYFAGFWRSLQILHTVQFSSCCQ
jgi:hypothetical protein